MDIFRQKKILVSTIVLLIVLNLLSIGFVLWKEIFNKQPRNDSKDDVSSVLEEKLNLTDAQVKQLRDLRKEFEEKERFLGDTIRSERDSMNTAMFNESSDDSLITSLAKRIADNEFKMEMLRFEQAKRFKTICTAEQMKQFEKLVSDIRDYFKPENDRPKEEPPKDTPPKDKRD